MKRIARSIAATTALAGCAVMLPLSHAQTALPSLDVQGYMGRWYQLAHYPNPFQAHCTRDSQAFYALQSDGTIDVTNRCIDQQGREDAVQGMAQPRQSRMVDAKLQPAQLQVSFLPSWLRWLPVGWAPYDVVHRATEGQWVLVSEPSKNYLWVLSRQPMDQRSDADKAAMIAVVERLGYDKGRLVWDVR